MVFTPRLRRLPALAAIAAALVLAGCATVPPPTNLMAQAQQQIKVARAAQANTYAPTDISFAEQRYNGAQAAINAKQYALASDLANESWVNGRLAQVRAELGATQAKISAQKAENAALQARLLNQKSASPAASASSQSTLPDQITLPQAQMPAGPGSDIAPAAADTTSGAQP